MESRGSLMSRIAMHRIALILGLTVIVGTVLRLIQADQAVTGDEVSTLWIVSNHGLADSVRLVSGDAEITPPLNFILSWFSVRLGSAPELVRLPALLSGIAAIPLVFLLGKKTVGERAGLLAAAIMALSPFMTYFSGNGRAYTLMILLLIGSTLTMLKASDEGTSRWWWVAYAALTCLAMYSHYTAIFVLLAQFAWLLVARPGSRVPGLLANVGAVIFFLPWIPGLRSDLDSPTTKVLEGLQGAKKLAFPEWTVGHPFIHPNVMPGRLVMVLVAAGLLVAIGLSARKLWISRESYREETGSRFPVPSGLVLVVLIAIATPLGELLVGLVGTDMFGARNMTASWYGFALAAGAVLSIPGGIAAIACSIVVLGGYGLAAAKLTSPDIMSLDFKSPARVIDRESTAGDVVIDMLAPMSTPVPLTPLEIHTAADPTFYNLSLPKSDPPFLVSSFVDVPPPEEDVEQGFKQARGHRVFLVTSRWFSVSETAPGEKLVGSPLQGSSVKLPSNAKIVETHDFNGFLPGRLYVIDVAK